MTGDFFKVAYQAIYQTDLLNHLKSVWFVGDVFAKYAEQSV